MEDLAEEIMKVLRAGIEPGEESDWWKDIDDSWYKKVIANKTKHLSLSERKNLVRELLIVADENGFEDFETEKRKKKIERWIIPKQKVLKEQQEEIRIVNRQW